MKRDMDLCRQILLELEEKEKPEGWVDLDIPGHTEEEVSSHARLLAEAALIDAIDLGTLAGAIWKAQRLRWAGHEFLDAARSDKIWQKTKTIVREKTGVLTIEMLKLGLTEVTKALLTGKMHLPLSRARNYTADFRNFKPVFQESFWQSP